MDLDLINDKLPRREILRGRDNFNLVFSQGKIIKSDHLIIIYIKSDSRKVGFVVSRKVRKAFQRNKFKRKLREIYRTNKRLFPDNYHYILMARGTTENFHELKNELIQLMQKVGKKLNS